MFAENRKISIRQLQMLLLLDCFGTAVLFLPAELAEISGRGCFFAALLGGLGVSAASLLLTAVGRRMPNGTVVDWCRSVCGNAIGTILLLGLAGKLLLDGMLELRIFSEIICRFMLPATPVWVLSLVLLLVAGALAAQGTECRGRTAEILFFLVAIPLLLVLLAVAASTQYARVLPLALPSPSGIGAGLTEMSIVFRGLVFLYFIYPDLKKPVGFAVWKGCLLITAVVLGVLLSLLFAAHWTEGYADMIQKGIGGKVVRFHVLANSDSEADQALKLAVRDRVLQEYGDLLETCTSKEETLAALKNAQQEISETAEAEVLAQGYTYPVRVSLVREEFPFKKYGDLIFPAGVYDALRIEIGEAKGKNWWCVLYPQMCYVDAAWGYSTEESHVRLQNTLTKEEFLVVSAMEQKKVTPKIKCRLVELWSER